MENNKITVEVAYALQDRQELITVQVPPGSCIKTAVQQSGLLSLFPHEDLNQLKVGVFSKPRLLTDEVKEGDRIEIYRPLTIDPKEARRAKAKKKP